jgi:hypothetical protein
MNFRAHPSGPGLRTGVARVLTFRRMLIVSEVVSEFALEGALDRGFGELLKQSVVAKQIIRRLVVFEDFINEFR